MDDKLNKLINLASYHKDPKVRKKNLNRAKRIYRKQSNNKEWYLFSFVETTNLNPYKIKHSLVDNVRVYFDADSGLAQVNFDYDRIHNVITFSEQHPDMIVIYNYWKYIKYTDLYDTDLIIECTVNAKRKN